MRSTVRWVVAPVFAVTIAGCGSSSSPFSSELSRREAASLIERSEFMEKPRTHVDGSQRFYLDDAGVKRGVDQGLWVVTILPYYREQRLDVTEAGQKYFRSGGIKEVQFATPVPRSLIEITGIGPAPMMGESVRIVQFTWRLNPDALPTEVRWIVEAQHEQVKRGSGQAMAMRYDDGWRIESVR